jgi:hypothetical protein
MWKWFFLIRSKKEKTKKVSYIYILFHSNYEYYHVIFFFITYMGMLELVVRSRLGRDGFIRTSSSLVIHTFLAILYFVSYIVLHLCKYYKKGSFMHFFLLFYIIIWL